VSSITGTANQVIASASTGAVTLSLPQSIATSSTPQFSALGLGGAAGSASTLKITGTTSGSITIAVAGTVGGDFTITLPKGTTDFSTTGGTNQVVKQNSAGGAFTVATLASTNLSDTSNIPYLNAANSFTLINPLTTIAESWIGPSSTTGIYFKGGNVGIGTTGPGSKLTLSSAGSTTLHIMTTADTFNPNIHFEGFNRHWYFGALDTGSDADMALSTNSDLSSANVTFTSGGNVGIGTTGPGAQLHTTGTVRFANFGAGTATFDANGNISSVSDRRFKDRITPLPYGLAEVCALRPIQHGYNALSGLDRSSLYGGFVAQDVQPVMPLAVGRDNRGYLTLSDRVILGATVNAIQTHEARLVALEQRMH
jgi:hypothetical protein